MYSGGELRIQKYQVQDQGGAKADGRIDEKELKEAIIDDTTNAKYLGELNDDTMINYDGKKFLWKDLKQELLTGNDIGKGKNLQSGTNVPPTEGMVANSARRQITEAQNRFNELEILKKAKADGKEKATLPDGTVVTKAGFKSEMESRVQQLQRIINQIQQYNLQIGKPSTEGIDAKWLSATQLTGEDHSGHGNGNGASGNTFKASMAPQQGFVPNAKAQETGNLGGGGPAANLFDGLSPSSTISNYGASLFLDQSISDGLGNVFAGRREGQRLMMLFLYYARMAASGDLGAMYQLTQFLNYIISKDKAKQNIQISGKLIQLQDMSRKATDALLKTKADGQNEGEFLKALHKAKADEGTISTSQKLLADMLQEFAHVVEAMTNSAKFMLDAWGRVLRTITRP